MRVTLLGCGGSAGVPMIGGPDGHGDWGACDPQEPRNRRSRASIVIETGHGEIGAGRLLVDTAPDLRNQLLASGISRVDAILFTHAHADHVTGLDDVRILNRIGGRPLPAAATEATLAELMQRFDYAFRPWQGPHFLRPVLVPHVVAAGQTLRLAGMDITLFDQAHGGTRSLGLRVGGFAYSTDVVSLPPESFAALEGLDTWVVGCFQREAHNTHAGVAMVLDWVQRLRPRRTVLTHMGNDLDWAWLHDNLPPGVEAGFDGMVIEV